MNDLKDIPVAPITLSSKGNLTLNGELTIEWRLFLTQLINKMIELEERIKVLEP